MDPEATAPPRQPNTPRTWIRRVGAWLMQRPDWLLVFVLGFLAGAVIG